MRILIAFLLLVAMIVPADALDIEAPALPGTADVPEADTFGEGLMLIVRDLIPLIRPDIHEASKVCMGIVCAVLLCTVFRGASQGAEKISDAVAVICIAASVLSGMGSLIRLAEDTIAQMNSYAKLLIPFLYVSIEKE